MRSAECRARSAETGRRKRRWVARERWSGGPSPPQKRGCSQGRATDPTSCRIQPLILPITNSTTLSLFALRSSLRTWDDSSHFQPAPVTSPTFSSSSYHRRRNSRAFAVSTCTTQRASACPLRAKSLSRTKRQVRF